MTQQCLFGYICQGKYALSTALLHQHTQHAETTRLQPLFISGPPIYLCASFHQLSHSLDPAGRLTTNLDVEENLWVDAAERRGLFGRATAPHVALASTVSLLVWLLVVACLFCWVGGARAAVGAGDL